MSKCPQVEIQELEERLEVAAYVATERQAYIAELKAEIAKLQAVLGDISAVINSPNGGNQIKVINRLIEQAIKEVEK